MTNETTSNRFWPDGTRLVISISMQFEAGGQPAKGADSPFPKVDFPENVPSDAAANTWSPMAIVKVFRACWTCGIATASRSRHT
jgi:hypothetical protein